MGEEGQTDKDSETDRETGEELAADRPVEKWRESSKKRSKEIETNSPEHLALAL